MRARPQTTVLICAGEASGDRLGAALMRDLKAKLGRVRFVGVGGALMQAEGLTPLFDMDDIAVMGLVEVIPAIPRVLNRVRRVVDWAKAHAPDLVITVDAQDFSARGRAGVRAARPEIPLVQVSSPTVWAWREGRVKALARDADLVLCLYPFEIDFLVARGVQAAYMVHPAVAAMAPYLRDEHALEVVLLPGSRQGEIGRHWPVILQAYRRLGKLIPQLRGVLVVGDERMVKLCRKAAAWDDGEISVVCGDVRFARLAGCKLALAKSGTNNLELALMGIPAVVGYRMNPLTYLVAKRLVKTRWISLPNIILGEVVYPEFVQGAFTPENLSRAAYGLLQDEKAWAARVAQLAGLRARMVGDGGAGAAIAALMGRNT